MSEEIPFCPEPFTFLSRDSERFMTCCPSWLHESRFIYDQPENLWDVWNHPILVELREALLRGDYRFCQKCPNRFRKRDRDKPLPDEKPVMERPPVTFQFQDNMTCNLHCPSCRNHVIAQKRGHPYSPDKVVADFPDMPTVAMSLSGDPFANKEHLAFLQQEGKPDVILWTNGILLPKYWHTIKRKVTVLVVSVDACTKPTYEKLRRGATWEQITRTLEFCSDLVANGSVAMLQLNFVVQVDNYLEIPEFVEMGLSYGAHNIQFTPIAPWPHITADEWARVNISDPRHPEWLVYARVLQDPLLKKPGVDADLICEAAQAIYGDMHAGENIWSSR